MTEKHRKKKNSKSSQGTPQYPTEIELIYYNETQKW